MNSGTAALGYIFTAATPGTLKMTQIYRTDSFAKPTRPPGTVEGGTPTSTRNQEQGDHVYTTNTTFGQASPAPGASKRIAASSASCLSTLPADRLHCCWMPQPLAAPQ